MTTSNLKGSEQVVQSARPSLASLARRGAVAGAVAAIGTTLVAASARAAHVSLEVDGMAIPIPAFAMWTIIGAALGVVLARLLRTRRRFLGVTIVATGLSLIPPTVLPDDGSSKVFLIAAHLLAAAVVIPALNGGLPRFTATREVPNR